jgi:hypothetical protein
MGTQCTWGALNKEHFKNRHNIQEKMIGDASVRDTSTLHPLNSPAPSPPAFRLIYTRALLISHTANEGPVRIHYNV